MTLADIKQIERAMANFNTCDHAGSTLKIEVDRLKGTKSFNGFCSQQSSWIKVEPICRKCLRHIKKKNRRYKKTAAARARISQGRLRQKQRLERASNQTYKPLVAKDHSNN